MKNSQIINLGGIADVFSGYAFKSSSFTDSGVPVIKIANIRIGSVDLHNAQYVDPSFLDMMDKKYRVRGGEILISLTGSQITQPNSVVGRVARQSRTNPLCLLNQRAGKIKSKDSSICDNGYLYWVLFAPETRAAIATMAHGAANQANVSPKQIKALQISLPSLTTQQRIAYILSAYDDLIENNTRRIQILEEMAQRIYTKWFVHFRFPGHEKVKMVDSELGRIPEGWEVEKLGELIAIRKGKNITKKTIVEGSVPVVAGGLKPAYYHNVSNTQQPVITISASGANAGFICLYQVEVWASDCSVIDLDTTPYIYYFYLHLKHRQTEVTRLQRGSAQPHVYPKDLMELIIIEVPGGLLEMFDKEVDPVFKMIKNLAQKNLNLRQTRDLLLPKLISGEIDVSEMLDVEEAAAA